ncbi:GFA family protein [Zavarzinia sp. CC-PAN008]|uniref:GFA family protein n=1 Tax=Zavarzinia sp. CC-PAN008 TaxID=3243332 RepID=UPI003F7476A4
MTPTAPLKGTCHCGACAWTLDGDPGPITACNCTLCRRYGALWAYDFAGERIHLSGPTRSYTRAEKPNPVLEILFCPACACVLAWRGLRLEPDGRRRMAVNVRLSAPEATAHLPIDHFDGLDTFEDLPRDGRCVRDMWF